MFSYKVGPLVVNVRPFAMPPSRVTSSKPICNTGILHSVKGNNRGLGVFLTYIKKFENLKIFKLNLTIFFAFLRSLSLSSLDNCPINGSWENPNPFGRLSLV